MVTSNTRDCFREFVGQRIIGLMFDAMPMSRADLRQGNVHLIFEDGRALTLNRSGSYWIDSAEDVIRALQKNKDRLEQLQRETAEAIAASGLVGAVSAPASEPKED